MLCRLLAAPMRSSLLATRAPVVATRMYASAALNKKTPAEAQEILKEAEAVCFDVDSTVITKEGIDELAAYLKCGDEVAALTKAAMDGGMPFHEAIEKRLKIFGNAGFSQAKLAQMLADEPIEECLSPGVADLVAALQSKGKRVFLVSGGFRQMINPIAAVLNVPETDVYANSFLFDSSGAFTGHDKDEPTSRAGGKAKVVATLKAKYGYKKVVMVGDGATDLEARLVEGGADAFIGYGAVAERAAVKADACWYLYDFKDMVAAL